MITRPVGIIIRMTALCVNPFVSRATILSPAESVTVGQSDKFVVFP